MNRRRNRFAPNLDNVDILDDMEQGVQDAGEESTEGPPGSKTKKRFYTITELKEMVVLCRKFIAYGGVNVNIAFSHKDLQSYVIRYARSQYFALQISYLFDTVTSKNAKYV